VIQVTGLGQAGVIGKTPDDPLLSRLRLHFCMRRRGETGWRNLATLQDIEDSPPMDVASPHDGNGACASYMKALRL
jgi:hypothetical protein